MIIGQFIIIDGGAFILGWCSTDFFFFLTQSMMFAFTTSTIKKDVYLT